ncbi:MAG: Lipoprotein, partial [Ilumatobacteraceae bacterium]|nr:Lipoprotein [Ilumatobacteraceae bacterium]
MRSTHESVVVARPRHGRMVLGVVAALGLVLAACGSDKQSTSTAAATATTAAAAPTTAAAGATTAAAGAATTAAAAATTAAAGAATTAATGTKAPLSTAKATGTPIKVMTEAPVDSQIAPYPNIPAAAKVYAQWINDHGGINGRPLEVVVCDDRADAAEAANCARKAVEEKVVANVGSFTVDVSRGIPILEENKIAWFGACC